MGAEEEDKNLNELVRVRHKNNSFLTTFLSVSYLVISYGDRAKGKSALFVSARENNGDEIDYNRGDCNDEILMWSGITVDHFDIVHRITRILMLIPDKLATACAIAEKKLPDDSGDFLINLVTNLYDKAIEEAIQKNYPNSFISSILDLREELRDITVGFVSRDIDQHGIEEFLKRCQPVLNAAKIIADWGHSEMVHVSRYQTFSADASKKLFDLCSKLYSRNLLSEYLELLHNV